MSFIIPLDSISQKEVERSFVTWLLSQSQYTNYTNLFLGEAGTILIKMFSGFMAYMQYNNAASTLENYLNFCLTRGGAIGASSNTPYNPFRGSNIHLNLRVIPSSNKSIARFDTVGFVNGTTIVSAGDYTFIQGVPIVIEVIVGTVEEEVITITGSSLMIFAFAVDKVSNDIQLELNNSIVPISEYVGDMIKDLWYVHSNAYGGVDAYYLNYNIPGGDPLYPYNDGDTLKLKYVKYQNVLFNFPGDLIFLYGSIDDLSVETLVLRGFTNLESKESIQVNAPISHEVQKLIKARLDFPKYFKLLSSTFTDTASRDVPLPVIYQGRRRAIPAFTDVTYVNQDKSLLSLTEKTTLNSLLNSVASTAHGIPEAEIIDPKEVALRLDLVLTKKEGKDNSTYIQDITNIFLYEDDDRGITRNRSLKFNYVMSLKSLEYAIERLPYVQVARVTLYKKNWSVGTVFKRGEFIVPSLPNSNGYMYEVVNDTYDISMTNLGTLSSGTEPTWSTTEGTLVYEGIAQRQPNTPYTLGTIVYPSTPTGFLYRVVQAGTSNSTVPVYGIILNEQFVDGTVVWETMPVDEVKVGLIYKTHVLDKESILINPAWNEYFSLSYGSGVTWV